MKIQLNVKEVEVSIPSLVAQLAKYGYAVEKMENNSEDELDKLAEERLRKKGATISYPTSARVEEACSELVTAMGNLSLDYNKEGDKRKSERFATLIEPFFAEASRFEAVREVAPDLDSFRKLLETASGKRWIEPVMRFGRRHYAFPESRNSEE